MDTRLGMWSQYQPVKRTERLFKPLTGHPAGPDIDWVRNRSAAWRAAVLKSLSAAKKPRNDKVDRNSSVPKESHDALNR